MAPYADLVMCKTELKTCFELFIPSLYFITRDIHVKKYIQLKFYKSLPSIQPSVGNIWYLFSFISM